jgi:hypothetical protein
MYFTLNNKHIQAFRGLLPCIKINGVKSFYFTLFVLNAHTRVSPYENKPDFFSKTVNLKQKIKNETRIKANLSLKKCFDNFRNDKLRNIYPKNNGMISKKSLNYYLLANHYLTNSLSL